MVLDDRGLRAGLSEVLLAAGPVREVTLLTDPRGDRLAGEDGEVFLEELGELLEDKFDFAVGTDRLGSRHGWVTLLPACGLEDACLFARLLVAVAVAVNCIGFRGGVILLEVTKFFFFVKVSVFIGNGLVVVTP